MKMYELVLTTDQEYYDIEDGTPNEIQKCCKEMIFRTFYLQILLIFFSTRNVLNKTGNYKILTDQKILYSKLFI